MTKATCKLNMTKFWKALWKMNLFHANACWLIHCLYSKFYIFHSVILFDVHLNRPHFGSLAFLASLHRIVVFSYLPYFILWLLFLLCLLIVSWIWRLKQYCCWEQFSFWKELNEFVASRSWSNGWYIYNNALKIMDDKWKTLNFIYKIKPKHNKAKPNDNIYCV